jgi:hypothetical protein
METVAVFCIDTLKSIKNHLDSDYRGFVQKLAFFKPTHALPLRKNQILNMTLAPSPDIIYVMVSYIENRGIEKYLLIFVFSYYYISFSFLLMLSKKKK